MLHLTWSAPAAVFVGLPNPIVAVACGMLGGGLTARLLRRRAWHWSWAALLAPAAYLVWPGSSSAGLFLTTAALTAVRQGRRWHASDQQAGGDLGRSAAARLTLLDAGRILVSHLRGWRAPTLTGNGLLLGHDARGGAVRLPMGGIRGGTHTLVVGATGSGKTVTQASIAVRTIEQGQAVIVVDPKGDRFLRDQLMRAASRSGARFIEWSPEGPSVFNPFARGSETEIADKALAAERFTEPHYLRQAQRYVGHEVRVLRAGGQTISLKTLVEHLEPVLLEVAARRLPEDHAQGVFAYLDALTTRQVRDLAGTRDRLAVLAESDAGRWLDPDGAGGGGCESPAAFELLGAVTERCVVYFRLDADRRPLLAEMLGAAIVQDLITAVSALQMTPTPSLVMIDEFSAVASSQVARLFGRARSAGMSLLLGTQELSDLRAQAGGQLLDQVLGNLGVLIAHRQVVPESATLVAEMAGTCGTWSTTQRSDGATSRSRSREFLIHPDQIRALPPGWSAVVRLGASGEQRVRVTRVQRPDEDA